MLRRPSQRGTTGTRGTSSGVDKVGYAYLSSTDVREDACMLRTESVRSPESLRRVDALARTAAKKRGGVSDEAH